MLPPQGPVPAVRPPPPLDNTLPAWPLGHWSSGLSRFVDTMRLTHGVNWDEGSNTQAAQPFDVEHAAQQSSADVLGSKEDCPAPPSRPAQLTESM